MDKFERLEFLRKNGFNTPDCILIRPNEEITDSIVKYLFSFKELQMRVFKSDEEGGNPIFQKVTAEECIEKIKNFQSQGFSCIPGPYIPIGDKYFSGACWKRNDGEPIIVEVSNATTPRKVTRDNIVEKRFISSEPNTENEHINRVIKLAKEFPISNVVLEFTCSRNPVGWNKENVMFWEIIDDGLTEQRFNKKLSESL